MKKMAFRRLLLTCVLCTSAALLITFWACNKTRSTTLGVWQLPDSYVRLVPDSVADAIATNFSTDTLYGSNGGTNHYTYKSQLHGNNAIKGRFVWNDKSNIPAVYIYNFSNGGFLFVSADSSMQPILAFVERGEYKKDAVPAGVIQWAEKTMSNIGIVRAGLYKPNTPVDAWIIGTTGAIPATRGKSVATAPGQPPPDCKFYPASSVSTTGPLLATTWGQECTYNELCGAPGVSYTCNDPLDCTTKPATGCVATATAQVIYYWHPANQYNYNYASMPLASGNEEVERLMQDIGLPANVNMSYGCAASGGSAADAGSVAPALIKNFGFTSANYAGYDYNTVVNDISGSHYPVLLAGCNSSYTVWWIIDWYTSYSDCHEWVCDGYSVTNFTYTSSCNPGIVYPNGTGNLLFHMNWGWHEVYAANDYNGWFSVSDWAIAESNGTVENFQYALSMTTGIHP